MDINNLLDKFYALERSLVESRRATQIVSWDRRVMAPAGAAESRAVTTGYLYSLTHSILTDEKNMDLLNRLFESSQMLEPSVAERIRIVKRDADRNSKIPAKLFERFSVLQAESEVAWEEAKRTDNWAMYKPHLENMFNYTTEFIKLWGYEGSPYNALLGYEEEGMTAEKLDELFDELRLGVVPLVKKIVDSGVEIDDSFCSKNYPVDIQRRMNKELLTIIGFNHDRGLLAESEHPYTTSFGPMDVRMTTHYYENRFLPAIFSTLHEGGHGMYEQNVSPSLDGTVLGRGLHGGFHESVSRFWENMVGRSYEFWKANMDMVKSYFPEQLKAVSAEDMYRAVNKSGRTLTRISADELTYNLHIMLRVELEKDVFEGRVKVEDLPELWKDKMESYLGIVPKDDRTGILQDIQWSMGQFGYFPSYTLGNIYNAQYTAVLRKELNFEKLVENNELGIIKDWLTEKLYSYGSLRTPKQTLLAITGEEVSAKYLVEYLENKFSKLYNLN